MVTKIMEWVPIPALLLAVTWHPSENYQILLHFLICTGAVMVVLVLFSTKHRIEAQYAVENRSNLRREVTVRL